MKKHINLYSKFDKFTDQKFPKVITKMDDYQLKLANIIRNKNFELST